MRTLVASHRRSRLILIGGSALLTGVFFVLPAAASAAGPVAAPVAGGTYSPAALSSVMARIPTARPWAAITRPLLSEWYVDPSADRVVVGLTRITSAARAAAREAFGGTVVLTVVPRATLAVRTLAADRIVRLPTGTATPDSSGGTRRNDHSPFYGGDEILSYFKTGPNKYNVVQCTSSFDAYDHLRKWNVTVSDGHCADGMVFARWYSGYISGHTFYLGSLEGVIDNERHENKSSDVLTITLRKKTATYSPHVFVGSATSSFAYSLAGSYAFSRGEKICTDGVDSGSQICGGSITNTNMCVVFSDDGQTVQTCHLAEATYKRPFCVPGDSGGPVYNDALTMIRKVYALGTIEGYTRGHDNCFINEIGPALSVVKTTLVTTG